MMQTGFFDWHERFEKLDRNGDPLLKLNQVVDWEMFRQPLEKIRHKERRKTGTETYFLRDKIWFLSLFSTSMLGVGSLFIIRNTPPVFSE